MCISAANIQNGQYLYMEDLQGLEECTDPACPIRWPTCPSPVCLSNWETFLKCHPDQRFANYIRTGFSSGFRIGYSRLAEPLRSSARNHPSTAENAHVVADHIKTEVEAGRLVGPLPATLYTRAPSGSSPRHTKRISGV